MKYHVTLVFDATNAVTVDADSPQEAIAKAYNSDQATVGLCHQCANDLEVGDCFRAIVHDDEWNIVLDDGIIENQLDKVTEERDYWKAKAQERTHD